MTAAHITVVPTTVPSATSPWALACTSTGWSIASPVHARSDRHVLSVQELGG